MPKSRTTGAAKSTPPSGNAAAATASKTVDVKKATRGPSSHIKKEKSETGSIDTSNKPPCESNFSNGAGNENDGRSTSIVSDGCNPLINDLLGSILSSTTSSTVESGGARGAVETSTQPGGINRPSNAQTSNTLNTFAAFGNGNWSRKSSEAASFPHPGSRGCPENKMAMDLLCKTSQQFVHTLRMFDMENYIIERDKESYVRSTLKKKKPVEIEGFVVALLDMLEDVRRVRGQVGLLAGSLLEHSRDRSQSLVSTMSTASIMRQPVQETNQLKVKYDTLGNRMINRYTIRASLGQGAYGKVMLGEEAETGYQVAIKIIDKKMLKKKLGGNESSESNTLKREIAIMKKVRHRNCVSLYEVIDDPDSNKLYLIMDYVPNGPIVKIKQRQLQPAFLLSVEKGEHVEGKVYNAFLIRSAIRGSCAAANTPLSQEEINRKPYIFCNEPIGQHLCAVYIRQLVSGLRYMHQRNLVHHDIKPDNVLLGEENRVFLTDFGVSEMLVSRPRPSKDKQPEGKSAAEEQANPSNAMKTAVARFGGGTLVFTAPELFDESIDPASIDPFLTDVWALGVTLYCMLVGTLPFVGRTYKEIAAVVQQNDFPWNGSDVYNKPLLPQWKTILQGMLDRRPKTRWHLTRLKEFLDNKSFQDEVKASAVDQQAASVAEEAARSCSEDSMDSLMEEYMKANNNANMAGGSGSGTRVPSGSMAKRANERMTSALRNHNSPRSRSRRDIGSVDMAVSESEIHGATKQQKIDLVVVSARLSDNTRRITHRYVERVRASVEARRKWFTEAPHRAPPASPSTEPIAGEDTTTVPSIAAVNNYHHTTGDSAPLSPPDTDSHNARHRATSEAKAQQNIDRLLNCGSQSLDAILSIVNLQSDSNLDGSISFSSSIGETARRQSASRGGRSIPRAASAAANSASRDIGETNSGNSSNGANPRIRVPNAAGLAEFKGWRGVSPSNNPRKQSDFSLQDGSLSCSNNKGGSSNASPHSQQKGSHTYQSTSNTNTTNSNSNSTNGAPSTPQRRSPPAPSLGGTVVPSVTSTRRGGGGDDTSSGGASSLPMAVCNRGRRHPDSDDDDSDDESATSSDQPPPLALRTHVAGEKPNLSPGRGGRTTSHAPPPPDPADDEDAAHDKREGGGGTDRSPSARSGDSSSKNTSQRRQSEPQRLLHTYGKTGLSPRTAQPANEDAVVSSEEVTKKHKKSFFKGRKSEKNLKK